MLALLGPTISLNPNELQQKMVQVKGHLSSLGKGFSQGNPGAVGVFTLRLIGSPSEI